MEVGQIDNEWQDSADLAFEVEAESYITAVKQSLIFQE